MPIWLNSCPCLRTDNPWNSMCHEFIINTPKIHNPFVPQAFTTTFCLYVYKIQIRTLKTSMPGFVCIICRLISFSREVSLARNVRPYVRFQSRDFSTYMLSIPLSLSLKRYSTKTYPCNDINGSFVVSPKTLVIFSTWAFALPL